MPCKSITSPLTYSTGCWVATSAEMGLALCVIFATNIKIF